MSVLKQNELVKAHSSFVAETVRCLTAVFPAQVVHKINPDFNVKINYFCRKVSSPWIRLPDHWVIWSTFCNNWFILTLINSWFFNLHGEFIFYFIYLFDFGLEYNFWQKMLTIEHTCSMLVFWKALWYRYSIFIFMPAFISSK